MRDLVSTDLLGPSTETEGGGEHVCANVLWPWTQRDGGWEGACVYRCTLSFLWEEGMEEVVAF